MCANDTSDSAYDILLALNDSTSLGYEIALSVILLLGMVDNSFSVWPQMGLCPNVYSFPSLLTAAEWLLAPSEPAEIYKNNIVHAMLVG